MSIKVGNAKAKSIRELNCSIGGRQGMKCPRHPKGHKYRGRSKCWGCTNATWRKNGQPYGPWRVTP